MRSFSINTRTADLEDAQNTHFDVIIIGGGINGAGVLRDASLRGLKVLLLEKYDFASGTSSKSSKLIHGGLRYLKQFAIRLTHESCMERNLLVRQNPHMIQPIPFLYPVYKGDKQGPFILRIGMLAYEILAFFQNYKVFRMLNTKKTLEKAPSLLSKNLLGSSYYYDASVDDARLVIETIKAGLRAGGTAFNRMNVAKFVKKDGKIRGVQATDTLSGESYQFSGSVVLNATGSWVDSIRKMDGKDSALLKPTKGVHVLIPKERFQHECTVAYPSLPDRRMMFAIPWGDVTLLGTTDTHYDGDRDFISTEPPDVDYILKSTNHFFPDLNLTHDDVVSTFAGLRPLIATQKTDDPGTIPREHQVFVDDSGLVSIAGGKLTTYRLICREIVDEILKHVPKDVRSRSKKCSTHTPITGVIIDVDVEVKRLVEVEKLPEDVATHLIRSYGPAVSKVLALADAMDNGRSRLTERKQYIRAEVVYAATCESAVNVSDVLTRRIRAAIWDTGQGLDLADPVSHILAKTLGWSEEVRQQSVQEYIQTIKKHHQSTVPSSAPQLVDSLAKPETSALPSEERLMGTAAL